MKILGLSWAESGVDDRKVGNARALESPKNSASKTMHRFSALLKFDLSLSEFVALLSESSEWTLGARWQDWAQFFKDRAEALIALALLLSEAAKDHRAESFWDFRVESTW